MKKQKIDFRLEAKKRDDKTLVYLYGDIVDEIPTDWWTGEPVEGDYITPKAVRDLLDSVDNEKIELHINSYGGSVFASVAIYNHLKNSDKKIDIVVDGLAASGASIIAMAGERLLMPENAQLMVHRASTLGYGNSKDLRKTAEILERLDKNTIITTYMAKFNGTAEELEEMIDAETWVSAEEAHHCGLCDEVIELKKQEQKTPTAQLLRNFANINF